MSFSDRRFVDDRQTVSDLVESHPAPSKLASKLANYLVKLIPVQGFGQFRMAPIHPMPWLPHRPTAPYGTLPNRSSVILGSIAAELSTFREKAGATRIPRTLSADTPLDSRSPRYDVSWV